MAFGGLKQRQTGYHSPIRMPDILLPFATAWSAVMIQTPWLTRAFFRLPFIRPGSPVDELQGIGNLPYLPRPLANLQKPSRRNQFPLTLPRCRFLRHIALGIQSEPMFVLTGGSDCSRVILMSCNLPNTDRAARLVYLLTQIRIFALIWTLVATFPGKQAISLLLLSYLAYGWP